MNNVQAM